MSVAMMALMISFLISCKERLIVESCNCDIGWLVSQPQQWLILSLCPLFPDGHDRRMHIKHVKHLSTWLCHHATPQNREVGAPGGCSPPGGCLQEGTLCRGVCDLTQGLLQVGQDSTVSLSQDGKGEGAVVVLHHTHVIVALSQRRLSLDVEAVGVPCTTKHIHTIKHNQLSRSQSLSIR